MKKSVEYLKEALEKVPGKMDKEKAEKLKISAPTLSLYLSGQRTMDDFACIMVATTLGIDPMEIIAAAQEEREKSEDRKAVWRDFRKVRGTINGAVLALTVTMGTALFPAPAKAEIPKLNVYIMSNSGSVLPWVGPAGGGISTFRRSSTVKQTRL